MSPMICVCLQRPVRRESLVQCVVCGEKGCKRHNKTDRKEALQVRCYLVYWTRPYTSPPLLSLSFLPPSLSLCSHGMVSLLQKLWTVHSLRWVCVIPSVTITEYTRCFSPLLSSLFSFLRLCCRDLCIHGTGTV